MNDATPGSAVAGNDGSVPSIASALYAPPPGLARPLRVTLVLPEQVPAWLSTFLDLAAATSWMEVRVLPVTGTASPTVADVPLDLRAFLALERLRRRSASATLSLVPIGARDGIAIAAAVRADVAPGQLTARVRELHPDLVVSLGPRSWSEALVGCAEWGCWNVDANLVDPDRAGMALLAPVLDDQSATEIALELQSPPLSPVSLAASWGSTHRGSFNQQREKAFLKLPLLLLRALRRLASDDLHVPRRYSGQLRQAPSPSPLGFAAGVRALAIAAYCVVLWQLKKRRPLLPWLLVVRQDGEPLDPGAPEVRSNAVIQAPAGTYWADPCVIDAAGRQLIFVEEMTPGGKGIVACLELRAGTVKRLGAVLEEPGHVSYPQAFPCDGQWYLTVESGGMRRVSLYKADEFPLAWHRVKDLVTDRVCADPTLHFHQGHWYLFATVAENGNSTWDELFLFVADELTGPFLPHPANPILSDVRRARPAGRLFHHGGRLIRPAQDCASDYGSAVVFNEVLELSPSRYRERPISRLAPDWSDSLVACHTYSAAGGIEVLDARGYPSAGTPRLGLIDAPLEAAISAPGANGPPPLVGIPMPRKGAVDEL